MAMKITPMTSYTKPAYPTYQESKQDAGLLNIIPKRWGNGSLIASLVGTGLLIQFACTGCRDSDNNDKETKTTLLFPSTEEQNIAKRKSIRTIPATRVAPMLEEALANDGRGGFGCVAISAPVFLSENEAIDLIQAELEKTGLRFHDMTTIEGLQVPNPFAESKLWTRKGNTSTWERREEPVVKTLKKGAYTFDLGTEDKSVVVHFLQKKEFTIWEDGGMGGSTYQSYDLSWLATQMSDAFKKRKNGNPVIIGLFFEPSTYPLQEKGQAVETYNDTKDRARDKLRAQVLHFVDYLKHEGIVE